MQSPAPKVSMSVHCEHDKECTYRNADLPVKLVIVNHEASVVGVPLEYLKRSGPYVSLINTKTKSQTSLKGNLADPEYMKVMTYLAPGASGEINWLITKDELAGSGAATIDLVAEFSFHTSAEFNGANVPLSVASDLTIHRSMAASAHKRPE